VSRLAFAEAIGATAWVSAVIAVAVAAMAIRMLRVPRVLSPE
jgi:hypothetical protein